MDIEFFKHIYKELIEPAWYSEKDDPNYYQVGRNVSTSFESENYNVIIPKSTLLLNCNNNIVRFLTDRTGINEYLASALSTEGDIAFMGMIKESHKEFAAMRKYHYNNVVVEGQKIDEDVPLKEEKTKREEKKEAKNLSKPIEYAFDGFEDTDINNGDNDRKMYGGSKKVIASVVVILLLVALFVILLLKKR